jgi:hypothetical protein
MLTQHHRRVLFTPASYSGGPAFRSRPWLRIYVIFLGASRKLLSCRLQLHNDRFLLYPFQFIFTSCPKICCHIISPNECAVRKTETKLNRNTLMTIITNTVRGVRASSRSGRFTLGKVVALPARQQAGWLPQSFWDSLREEKFSLLLGI